MKTVRLLVVTGLMISMLGIASPASACDDPRKGCGGCYVNPNFNLRDDRRPILCYS